MLEISTSRKIQKKYDFLHSIFTYTGSKWTSVKIHVSKKSNVEFMFQEIFLSGRKICNKQII